MTTHFTRVSAVAAAMIIAGFGGSTALAQEAQTAGGFVVNFGIVPAEVALRDSGHRDAHPKHAPPGWQHLLITLDKADSHARVSDAEVIVAVTDPHGRTEQKPMLHTHGGGMPDYSELFRFDWSGTYRIRASISPAAGARPVDVTFTVHHAI